MQIALPVILALLVGAIAGGAIVYLFFHATRSSDKAVSIGQWKLPSAVAELIELLEVPALIVDPSHNVQVASPLAHALGLVQNGQLVTPELIEMVDSLRDGGEPINEELDIARGPFGDATLSIAAQVARFGVRFTLILVVDKTEYRRLEEVRRDFVANISHELKTPIGAVGLLAEALNEAAENPDMVRRFAESLTTESQRLASLTQEIIDLSRLQAQAALSDPQVVSLDNVIAQAVSRNHVASTAKNLSIVVGGEKGLSVWGDEPSLVVAFNNLISNAVQYSPQDSSIGIGVSNKDNYAEIAITDKGIGMNASEVARVFERFYRTDEARSRATGGTGLGLSIVKHTIMNHGGDVRVWSKMGHGSTFTVRIPLHEESESITQESA